MEKLKILFLIICSCILVILCMYSYDKKRQPNPPPQSIEDVMAEEAGYPVIRDQYGRQIS